MYKYNASMLPIKFINYLTKYSAIHVHNTRSADNFHSSFSVTQDSSLGLNSIRHAGPRTLNNLPYDLKITCSLYVFNRSITFMLIKEGNN